MTPPLAIVILAAGKGKRMNNPELPKVMHPVGGRPMVDYVVDLAAKLNAQMTLVVVGWKKDVLVQHLSGSKWPLTFVEQTEQLGTGHAVLQTGSALMEFEGDVLVLSGDVPLLIESTASALIGYHRASGAVATILTAEVSDPSGYGRIIRNKEGNVEKIVEDKEATKKEKDVREINSGIYVFKKANLFEPLRQLERNNAQGEYYLTDVFEHFLRNKWQVSAVKALDAFEVTGINDADQLQRAEKILRLRAAT